MESLDCKPGAKNLKPPEEHRVSAPSQTTSKYTTDTQLIRLSSARGSQTCKLFKTRQDELRERKRGVTSHLE